MTKTLVVPEGSETNLEPFSGDEWLNQETGSRVIDDFTFNNIIASEKNIVEVGQGGTISKTLNYQSGAQYLVEFTLENTNPLEVIKIDITGKTITKRSADVTYAYPVYDFAVNVRDVMESGKLEIKLPPGKYVLKNLRLTVTPLE